ncbi:hypothetical protein [Streptomyces meridianus]|uniref:Uncharacterized protein n=1 Tax=Streptomyces meridianus TaxID=2938945 RepID=A0ABT0X721_9ACTN|nr:hypothetical protein [Streptomyces meridianus]MCM2578317.1 hypothetical protein [Streptomyces meridianus]
MSFTVYTIEVALAHMRELQERADRSRTIRGAAGSTRTRTRFPRARKR